MKFKSIMFVTFIFFLSGCDLFSNPQEKSYYNSTKKEAKNKKVNIKNKKTDIFKIIAPIEYEEYQFLIAAIAKESNIAINVEYYNNEDLFKKIKLESGTYDAILIENDYILNYYIKNFQEIDADFKQSLFVSPIVLIINKKDYSIFGWDKKPPTWVDLIMLSDKKQLRYAMLDHKTSSVGLSTISSLLTESKDKNNIDKFLRGNLITSKNYKFLNDEFFKSTNYLNALFTYENSALSYFKEHANIANDYSIVYVTKNNLVANNQLVLLNKSKASEYNEITKMFKNNKYQLIGMNSLNLTPVIRDAPINLAADLKINSLIPLTISKLQINELKFLFN